MSKTNEIALIKRDTVDVVADKVRKFQESGELCFPANYSPENAMKAAWLTIQETVDKNQKPALEVCTRDSIANALLKMVIQGLNPAKQQCYFVVYGNKLTLQRSYFGAMHVAKTVDPNIADIVGEVVYEGQTFKYAKKNGYNYIVEHQMQLGDSSKPVVGAYCQVLYKDGTENSTVMTIDEIMSAWNMSPTHPIDQNGELKASSTHAKFPGEMAKKTVINRACKSIINSSGDDTLLIEAYRQTDADLAEAEAQEEIEAKANSVIIEDFKDGEDPAQLPGDTPTDDLP